MTRTNRYIRLNGKFSYDKESVSNRVARIYCDDFSITTSEAVAKYAETYGWEPKKSTVKRIISDLRKRHREIEAFLYDNKELRQSTHVPSFYKGVVVFTIIAIIVITAIRLFL